MYRNDRYDNGPFYKGLTKIKTEGRDGGKLVPGLDREEVPSFLCGEGRYCRLGIPIDFPPILYHIHPLSAASVLPSVLIKKDKSETGTLLLHVSHLFLTTPSVSPENWVRDRPWHISSDGNQDEPCLVCVFTDTQTDPVEGLPSRIVPLPREIVPYVSSSVPGPC